MSSPKDNLLEMQKSKFIKVLIPQRSGYGYTADAPIEVSSPVGQTNFIQNIIPSHEGITNVRLIDCARSGSFSSSIYDGIIDEYELAFAYYKDGKPHAELFVIYFSFYPKKGEDYAQFLYRTTHNSPPCPEGLKRLN